MTFAKVLLRWEVRKRQLCWLSQHKETQMRRCLYAAPLILMAAAPAAWAEEPRLEKMRHKTILGVHFTPR